jgi:hypothetical protein
MEHFALEYAATDPREERSEAKRSCPLLNRRVRKSVVAVVHNSGSFNSFCIHVGSKRSNQLLAQWLFALQGGDAQAELITPVWIRA